MRKYIIAGISIFLIWLVPTPQVSAGVIYVNDDAPGPVHNGSSWNEAFVSLQDGLDAAQTYDTIWVAKGTYKPEKLFDPNEPRSASVFRFQVAQLVSSVVIRLRSLLAVTDLRVPKQAAQPQPSAEIRHMLPTHINRHGLNHSILLALGYLFVYVYPARRFARIL